MQLQLTNYCAIVMAASISWERFFLVVVCTAGLTTNYQLVTAARRFGSYMDVYPAVDLASAQLSPSCEPSEQRKCPLFVALSMSFGLEYVSGGVVASIRYALDQINNETSLLPGYSLHYTLTDSQVGILGSDNC